MYAWKIRRSLLIVLVGLLASYSFSQTAQSPTDSTHVFNSQLLKLKVPEAFQKNSLKLEIFADSSWQLYRGNQALSFPEAMRLLNQPDKARAYLDHQQQAAEYESSYRSRQVFAIITAVGGASYLAFIWSKGWVYQIPGYAALAVASGRLLESRQYENRALRERYYLQSLMPPSELRKLVDEYNFKLYQFLSTAGIQFSGS